MRKKKKKNVRERGRKEARAREKGEIKRENNNEFTDVQDFFFSFFTLYSPE